MLPLQKTQIWKKKIRSLATIFFVWLSEELEINSEWSKKVTWRWSKGGNFFLIYVSY